MSETQYRVGIVAAMEREVRPLMMLKEWGWRTRQREHNGRAIRFLETDKGVVLVCGGIGAQAARRAAVALLELYAPKLMYSVGFAGALEPGLKAGEVIVPSQVVDAGDGSRVDVSGGDGVLVTFGSVASPAQKALLRESYGARIVDMEAAAVARVALAHGVQFAALKAISDEFDFEFPEMGRFVDSHGQFRVGGFARFVVARPWLWRRVRRLAGNAQKAEQGLNDWLIPSLRRSIAQAPDRAGEVGD